MWNLLTFTHWILDAVETALIECVVETALIECVAETALIECRRESENVVLVKCPVTASKGPLFIK